MFADLMHSVKGYCLVVWVTVRKVLLMCFTRIAWKVHEMACSVYVEIFYCKSCMWGGL